MRVVCGTCTKLSETAWWTRRIFRLALHPLYIPGDELIAQYMLSYVLQFPRRVLFAQ